MNLPTLNFTQWTNEKGELTGQAQQFLQQLMDALQLNLGNEGYVMPKQASDDITRLDNSKSANTLIVNSTTNELLFNQNGTYKTVQLA